jgi:hypothetical protein
VPEETPSQEEVAGPAKVRTLSTAVVQDNPAGRQGAANDATDRLSRREVGRLTWPIRWRLNRLADHVEGVTVLMHEAIDRRAYEALDAEVIERSIAALQELADALRGAS